METIHGRLNAEPVRASPAQRAFPTGLGRRIVRHQRTDNPDGIAHRTIQLALTIELSSRGR